MRRLHAPNKMLWLVAVILGILGALGGLAILHIPYAFYLMLIAFLLLAIGTAI